MNGLVVDPEAGASEAAISGEVDEHVAPFRDGSRKAVSVTQG